MHAHLRDGPLAAPTTDFLLARGGLLFLKFKNPKALYVKCRVSEFRVLRCRVSEFRVLDVGFEGLGF